MSSDIHIIHKFNVTIQPYGVFGPTRCYAAPSPLGRAVGSLTFTRLHAESVLEYSPGWIVSATPGKVITRNVLALRGRQSKAHIQIRIALPIKKPAYTGTVRYSGLASRMQAVPA